MPRRAHSTESVRARFSSASAAAGASGPVTGAGANLFPFRPGVTVRAEADLGERPLSQTAAEGPVHTPPLARASTVVHRHTHLKEQT